MLTFSLAAVASVAAIRTFRRPVRLLAEPPTPVTNVRLREYNGITVMLAPPSTRSIVYMTRRSRAPREAQRCGHL